MKEVIATDAISKTLDCHANVNGYCVYFSPFESWYQAGFDRFTLLKYENARLVELNISVIFRCHSYQENFNSKKGLYFDMKYFHFQYYQSSKNSYHKKCDLVENHGQQGCQNVTNPPSSSTIDQVSH